MYCSTGVVCYFCSSYLCVCPNSHRCKGKRPSRGHILPPTLLHFEEKPVSDYADVYRRVESSGGQTCPRSVKCNPIDRLLKHLFSYIYHPKSWIKPQPHTQSLLTFPSALSHLNLRTPTTDAETLSQTIMWHPPERSVPEQSQQTVFLSFVCLEGCLKRCFPGAMMDLPKPGVVLLQILWWIRRNSPRVRVPAQDFIPATLWATGLTVQRFILNLAQGRELKLKCD